MGTIAFSRLPQLYARGAPERITSIFPGKVHLGHSNMSSSFVCTVATCAIVQGQVIAAAFAQSENQLSSFTGAEAISPGKIIRSLNRPVCTIKLLIPCMLFLLCTFLAIKLNLLNNPQWIDFVACFLHLCSQKLLLQKGLQEPIAKLAGYVSRHQRHTEAS